MRLQVLRYLARLYRYDSYSFWLILNIVIYRIFDCCVYYTPFTMWNVYFVSHDEAFNEFDLRERV